MKLSSPDIFSAVRPEILRSRHLYGLWFGVALGLGFAIFAWGIDAYLLSKMHGLLPWLKFLCGVISCMAIGGLAGWLSARWNKPLAAVILWGAAAGLFAWLTVNLPVQITPRILSVLQPDLGGLLHSSPDEALSARFGVAYIWIGLFVVIAGLLQIPLSDSAVFSNSVVGKIFPMLIVFVLMTICGTILDGLNNEALRSPVDALDSTIQFVIDHRGSKIDPADVRRLHLGALRNVENLLTPQRRLLVSEYDHILEKGKVLARFDSAWMECEFIASQLIRCEQVRSPG